MRAPPVLAVQLIAFEALRRVFWILLGTPKVHVPAVLAVVP